MKPPAKRFYRRREALRTFIALVAAFCIWTPLWDAVHERTQQQQIAIAR